MKKLICFGDSITEGELSDNGTERLTPRLRSALKGWEIVNAGISGNNTQDALIRLEKDVLKQYPDVVIILFGANDAASHKQIAVAEYESNLSKIVLGIGPKKSVLITPSPVDESRPRNRTNEVLNRYSEAVKHVALSTGSQCIDLFSKMIQVPDYVCMLSDGLHFGESGYDLLSQLIIDKVKNSYLL